MGHNQGRGLPNKPGFLQLSKEQDLESPPQLPGLGHSPVRGACSLAVTAQSLLQEPQAVLPGLHQERRWSHEPPGCGMG